VDLATAAGPRPPLAAASRPLGAVPHAVTRAALAPRTKRAQRTARGAVLGAVGGVAVAVVGQVLSQGIDGTDSGRPFLHDRNTQLTLVIGAGVGAMVGAALARGE
jgi:hypothetical protein